jgi:hypothetical protein
MIVINLEPLLVEQIADELTGKSIEVIEQWAVRDPLLQQIGIELRKEFQHQLQGFPILAFGRVGRNCRPDLFCKINSCYNKHMAKYSKDTRYPRETVVEVV